MFLEVRNSLLLIFLCFLKLESKCLFYFTCGQCRLYYRRVEEGKQYPVLCRRLATLHEEFISNKSPSAGFDFTSGKKIEQKLLDYNEEAERFGGICLFLQLDLYILLLQYDITFCNLLVFNLYKQVMPMKNYQKSHLITDILHTLCMIRIMITSNCLLET